MATSTTTTSPTTTGWCVSRGTEECGSNPAFTIDEIYSAYASCRKNKSGKLSCLRFEEKLEKNLFSLKNDLNNDEYELSKSEVFVVTDPKIREVWASNFRDRVVHHLIINKIEPLYEDNSKGFCFTSTTYSCRKNKGTHKAVIQVKKLMKYKYFIQMDLKAFFYSINRKMLYDILCEDLKREEFEKKDEIFKLIKKIIFHKYTEEYVCYNKEDLTKVPEHKSLFFSEKNGKGQPIGNLTSQFFANVYLNKLDKYIISLNLEHVRYVDDFVIFGDNLQELKDLETKINNYLKKDLDIELNLQKTIIGATKKGMDFLGYYVKPTHTLIRRRVKNKLIIKRNKLMKKNKLDYEVKELIKMRAVFNSYYGHFKLANSYNFKKKFVESLNGLFTLKEGGSLKMYVKKDFKTAKQQHEYFKKHFEKTIIVFQMGKFYRFFEGDARFVSQKLGLKLVKRKNEVFCGFPLESKKFEEFKNLGYNYVLIIETGNKLITGIQERVLKEKNLHSLPFVFNAEEYEEKKETINDVLKWDLNTMTPLETYRKLSYIIERSKK